MTTCAYCGGPIVHDGKWRHTDTDGLDHSAAPQSVYDEAFAAGRIAALEEAALVADEWEGGRDIALAIRYLKDRKT